jgi:segregation and condensation protein A
VLAELKNLYASDNVEDELQGLDLYKLLKVYQKLSRRFENENAKPMHTVVQYTYTVDGQKELIIDKLKLDTKLAFSDFFQEYKERIAIVFNFLAILEMLQMQIINVFVGEGYNNFWIELKEGYEMARN